MKYAAALALALAASTGAWADEQTEHAVIGGAADCLTTYAALAGAGDALMEFNPLGPVGACALKAVGIVVASQHDEPVRTTALHAIEATSLGAAANNITHLVAVHVFHMAAGPIAPAIGIAVSLIVMANGRDEREFREHCVMHERLTGQKMNCVFTPRSRT